VFLRRPKKQNKKVDRLNKTKWKNLIFPQIFDGGGGGGGGLGWIKAH
jgi:hypothetical protein